MTDDVEIRSPTFDIAYEVGSREFERRLTRLGLPVRVRYLSSADFAFYGNGPSGLVRVGIERKKVQEMVGEHSRKRFTGRQLPRMSKRYGYRFLIVEGRIKVDDRGGSLMEGRDITSRRQQEMTLWHEAGWGRSPTTYENYLKRELTTRLKAAMQVVYTGSEVETGYALHAIYRWFQKAWSEHRSSYALDTLVEVDEQILDERSWFRDMLAKMPGVSWKRSRRVANYFRSLDEACSASAAEWQKALGFVEGRKTASTIVRFCQSHHREVAKGS